MSTLLPVFAASLKRAFTAGIAVQEYSFKSRCGWTPQRTSTVWGSNLCNKSEAQDNKVGF